MLTLGVLLRLRQQLQRISLHRDNRAALLAAIRQHVQHLSAAG
jgi:hypothetical protein